MAALRMGCLPLEVETGRFGCAARPLQQRICKLCSTDVENEEHFLLHCHALKEERKDLFNAMCKTEGNKFLCLNATAKVLLILKLAQQPRQICKLVFSMYSKRRSLLLKWYHYSYKGLQYYLPVLLVVCPLVIPRGLPEEDLSVLFVVCPFL